jgi:quercetin dioxygenase-like cupin family protein
MMRTALLSAALLLPLAALNAQQQQSASSHAAAKAIVVMPDAVKWGPGPPALPAGASASVLEGDPGKPGVFTLRLRFPDGYKIAPHYHPGMEHITVMSGNLMVGMGDTYDEGRMNMLPAGSFGAIPPRMNHYAMAHGETVIQLHGTGPWRLVYLNKADDPRTKAK